MASRLSILVVFGIFLQYCPVDLLPGGFIPKFRGLPTFFNRLDKKHPTIYTISSNIPENACGYSMAILIPFIPGKIWVEKIDHPAVGLPGRPVL